VRARQVEDRRFDAEGVGPGCCCVTLAVKGWNDRKAKGDQDTGPEGEGTREVALALPNGWFEQFWKKYPAKRDPKGSKKMLAEAVSEGVPLQTIMDGLDRYLAKTDDRPWCTEAVATCPLLGDERTLL
jgi:hypothetical protein